MSDLSKKYKEILNEIEMTIKDPQQLNFVKMKIADLSLLYMDIIDRMSQITDNKVKEIESMQDQLENKLSYVENSVNEIEKDIYEDDIDDNYEDNSGYEFEIVCPYCNHEFTTDVNMEFRNEIICPDCNNVIELDWNEDEQEHNCGGCGGNCQGHQEQTKQPAPSQVAEQNEEYIPNDVQNNTQKPEEENKTQENVQDQSKIATDNITIKNRSVKPSNSNQVSINTDIDDEMDDDEDM